MKNIFLSSIVVLSLITMTGCIGGDDSSKTEVSKSSMKCGDGKCGGDKNGSKSDKCGGDKNSSKSAK
jgi:uncharacterized low-complexity protein